MASYGTSHGERVCEACVFGRTTPPAKCCLRLLEATKLAWASHWAVRPYTVRTVATGHATNGGVVVPRTAPSRDAMRAGRPAGQPTPPPLTHPSLSSKQQ
jgi:hypothetical protein